MLGRDQHLPFEQSILVDSRQIRSIFRKLIKSYDQSDREQFCAILLDNNSEPVLKAAGPAS